jgi:hypothetical protein
MSIPSTGVINAPAANATNNTPIGAVATVAAVMYNYYDPTLASENAGGLLTNSANRIVLNPYLTYKDISYNTPSGPQYAITLTDFLNLFYATNSGYFNVNPSNVNNQATILNYQTYTSANTPTGLDTSTTNTFSLYQELLKAYCYSKAISVNDLDPRILLLLQKETFATQSLTQVKGTTIALGWDELVGTLNYSGLINLTTSNTHLTNGLPTAAVVPINIIFNYHSFVLDIDLAIVFTYQVALTTGPLGVPTGYVNTNTPAIGLVNNFPAPPYTQPGEFPLATNPNPNYS